jgi:hypothetical protein
MSFAIANDDESIETHGFATLFNTGDTVDGDDSVLEIVFNVTESATSTTSFAWFAFVVAEFTAAWAFGSTRSAWFILWVSGWVFSGGWLFFSGDSNSFIFFHN